MRRGLLRSVVAICIALNASTAWSANFWELNFWLRGPRYDSNVPLCTERGPRDKIIARFATKEYRFWNSDLQIVGYESIREIAWEPWKSGTIPRRFCTASVVMSDAPRHAIS